MQKRLVRLFSELRELLLYGGFSHRSYAQEGEDMILERIFGPDSIGFYVDVGACHPMRFSNTFNFYKKGWHGINIEPNPNAISLFKKFRRRDININCGVAEDIGRISYFMFDEPALNTFSSEIVTQRLASTTYKIIGQQDVNVLPLKDILNQHLPSGIEIDFMTIDAEGYDIEVLKSNDWSRYRPKWVLVEQLGLKDLTSISGDVPALMQASGYVLFAKTFNTLFYKNNN